MLMYMLMYVYWYMFMYTNIHYYTLLPDKFPVNKIFLAQKHCISS